MKKTNTRVIHLYAVGIAEPKTGGIYRPPLGFMLCASCAEDLASQLQRRSRTAVRREVLGFDDGQ